MAVPIYIDDGDYSVAQQNGCDEFSLPFFDRGDGDSFEVQRTMRVAATKYVRPKMMLKVRVDGFGDAYLVEHTDPSSVGNGLVEYKLTFASVPRPRFEGGSIAWAMQFLSTQATYNWENPPAAPEVSEVPITLSCRFLYEYFTAQPPPLIAPRVAVLNGTIFKFGDFGTFRAGQQIIAEDSEIGIYKGGIYYRKTPYVKWPGFVTA